MRFTKRREFFRYAKGPQPECPRARDTCAPQLLATTSSCIPPSLPFSLPGPPGFLSLQWGSGSSNKWGLRPTYICVWILFFLTSEIIFAAMILRMIKRQDGQRDIGLVSITYFDSHLLDESFGKCVNLEIRNFAFF